MAFSNNLPISEALGVFVGVAGFEWLVDGRAEPANAALAALGAGIAILIVRALLNGRRR